MAGRQPPPPGSRSWAPAAPGPPSLQPTRGSSLGENKTNDCADISTLSLRDESPQRAKAAVPFPTFSTPQDTLDVDVNRERPLKAHVCSWKASKWQVCADRAAGHRRPWMWPQRRTWPGRDHVAGHGLHHFPGRRGLLWFCLMVSDSTSATAKVFIGS